MCHQPRFQRSGEVVAWRAGDNGLFQTGSWLIQKTACVFIGLQQLLHLLPQVTVVAAGFVEECGTFFNGFDLCGCFEQRIQIRLTWGHEGLRPARIRCE